MSGNRPCGEDALRAAAREALAHFAIEVPPTPGIVQVSTLRGGHIHESFLISIRPEAAENERATDAPRKFVLQRLNTRVFARPLLLMENFERVCAQLARAAATRGGAAERAALRLVRTHEGANCWSGYAGVWRMTHFIEGSCTRAVVDGPDDAFEAARAFGRFQADLLELGGRRLHEVLPGFHDTPRRFDALRRAAQMDRAGRTTACKAELEALQARCAECDVLLRMHAAGAIPERLAHNDAKVANVLFDARRGGALGVIDLDTVMPGLSLWDFGDMARSMSTRAAEDEDDLSHVAIEPELYRALVEGYLAGTGGFLTLAERSALFAAAWVITLEQAARFLTDYLDGDRYYRVADPQQNLRRGRNQIALVGSLEQQEAVLRRIAM